jgi:SNF2 family DNA or RNA helicase
MASHVYLLEPQWNPSVERQAIGCAARLGQRHRVRVVRYVVQDSIKEV